MDGAREETDLTERRRQSLRQCKSSDDDDGIVADKDVENDDVEDEKLQDDDVEDDEVQGDDVEDDV